MQHRPAAPSHIDSQNHSSPSPPSPPPDRHHGLPSPLLSIPPETLACITAHLGPPALLSLACASSYLAHHVRQDSTWRSAFVLRFLRVDPADDSAILLRRHASSWRQDFIARYVMLRRWARSRNLPVTHTPLMQSPLSAIHIVPSQPQAAPALLTASTQYGIVARSFPLSGRVLPGYLDASATGARPALGAFGPAANWGIVAQGNLNHFWNGNPNAHFTPNITTSALSSSAADKAPVSANATANIAWGSRAGEVLFTTAPRVMDAASTTRRANPSPHSVRVRRCAVGEEHDGSVEDVRWVVLVNSLGAKEADTFPYAVSAGADGRVKLWDATGPETEATNMCLWTSQMVVQKDRLGVFPDPCLKVEALMNLDSDGGTGHIVSVVQSGNIHVWTGFTLGFDGSAPDNSAGTFHTSATNVREIIIPRPTFTRDEARVNSVKALSIDPKPSADVVLLVAYEDEPVFYRIRIRGGEHLTEDQVEITPFGDPHFGPTSVVVPFFARNGRKEASFVLVGDHIGCVSLYAWDASSSPNQPIFPLRSFEAHRDGASVTALWWDGLLLVTGSSRGTTHVWDGMTFEHLRSFMNPIKRVRGRNNHQGANANGETGREAVRHLLVNKESDVLIVGLGGVVLAWHAGPVSGRNKEKGMGVRGRHPPGTAPGKKRGGGAKYIGQFEMRQTILESQSILDHEAATTRRAHGREREHLAGLESLGLSEVEAVEYVLMLSRDEAYAAERQRLEAMAEVTETEQGVFEGDFDDFEADDERSDAFEGPPSVYSSASSSASVSSMSRSSSSGSGYNTTRDDLPLASIQIQPRLQTLVITAPQRQYHHLSASNSNGRVQVVSSLSHSHLHRAEPMEAGEEHFDYEVEAEEANRLGIERELQRESRNEHSFPLIPAIRASPPGPSSLSPPAPGINASPKSVKSDSAWSVPLTKRASFSSASASGPSSPSTSNSARINSSPVARPHGIGSGMSYIPAAEDDMDEDLRFALELSLVEARSRGEDV